MDDKLYPMMLNLNTIKGLSERARRLIYGEYASKLGWGGIKIISELYHVDPDTVSRGKKEYEDGEGARHTDRIRAIGGGAKKFISKHPEVGSAIIQVVAETSYGDVFTTRKWYDASNKSIADRVTEMTGITTKPDTVRRYLQDNDYHRLKNHKNEQDGPSDPNRNAQFEHILAKRDEFTKNKWPIYSNDALNKVLKGNYCGKGSQLRKQHDHRNTFVHDFGSDGGKYSIACCYSMSRNHAYFNVTLSHDVPLFSAETQRHALVADLKCNPNIKKVLFLTDGGGSDGRRSRVYKALIGALALELGIEIHICFYPRGTSKFDPVEHLVFPNVVKCCAGQSFTTDEVTIDMLSKVHAKSHIDGIDNLTSQAQMDKNKYNIGMRVSDSVLSSLPIEQDNTENGKLGYLNYIFNRGANKVSGKYVEIVEQISGIVISDVMDMQPNEGYKIIEKDFAEITYGCSVVKRMIAAKRAQALERRAQKDRKAK